MDFCVLFSAITNKMEKWSGCTRLHTYVHTYILENKFRRGKLRFSKIEGGRTLNQAVYY